MHELSLCQSIYGIVDRARDGRSVATVELTVGQLRQVIPETLVACWEVVTSDGPLAGSRLDIDHIPGRLQCAQCQTQTTLDDRFVFGCPSCGSVDVVVVSGEEFLVTALQLEDA